MLATRTLSNGLGKTSGTLNRGHRPWSVAPIYVHKSPTGWCPHKVNNSRDRPIAVRDCPLGMLPLLRTTALLIQLWVCSFALGPGAPSRECLAWRGWALASFKGVSVLV